VLTLRQPPGPPLVTHTLRGLVHGFTVYLVPRADGRLVVGATVQERGWDTRVTAGGAYELLRDALALVPGLDDAELVAARAGLRPGTPDDLPLIGRSAMEGLVVATGHYRNGILLTPITAEAVVAAVAGDPPPPEVGACDPRRFEQVRV
jgi:glycine oxidase